MTDIPEVSINGGVPQPQLSLNGIIQRIAMRVGGAKWKEVDRFIKFACVGVIGTLVDLGISAILLKFVFHVSKDNAGSAGIVATTISFVIAVCSNFILNRYWTYPDSRSRPIVTQLGQFFAVNIVGWLIRSGVILLLAVPFANLLLGLHAFSITADSAPSWGTEIALVSAISVVMIWNFFINRYWTYNDVK